MARLDATVKALRAARDFAEDEADRREVSGLRSYIAEARRVERLCAHALAALAPKPKRLRAAPSATAELLELQAEFVRAGYPLDAEG